jgi:hypothetical protein
VRGEQRGYCVDAVDLPRPDDEILLLDPAHGAEPEPLLVAGARSLSLLGETGGALVIAYRTGDERQGCIVASHDGRATVTEWWRAASCPDDGSLASSDGRLLMPLAPRDADPAAVAVLDARTGATLERVQLPGLAAPRLVAPCRRRPAAVLAAASLRWNGLDDVLGVHVVPLAAR